MTSSLRTAAVSFACLLQFVVASGVTAQQVINSRDAARVGLEPMWSMSVPVGPGGSVTAMSLHVSSTESYQATDVIDSLGRRSYFSELRLGRRGVVVNADEVDRLAELRVAELRARGLEPNTTSRSVPEVTLYVRSSLGTLTAIDAETGHEKWTTLAGKDRYPNYAASATDDYVATISGSSLYLIDNHTGRHLDTVRLPNAAGTAPTVFGTLVYAPMINGVVNVYSVDNLRTVVFTLGSNGRISHPLTIGSESVSWSTDDGHVFAAAPGQPGLRFRFQALDRITSATAQSGGLLFATSMDGFLYAISERQGDVRWRYALGGPASTAPLVTGASVFALTDDGMLTCVDVNTGEARWGAPGVEQMLTAGESRIYCRSLRRNLVSFDVATGSVVGFSPIHHVAKVSTLNPSTDRIYLVGSDGSVQGLREQGSRWPMVRTPPKPQTTDAATDKTTESAEDTPPRDELAPSAADDESADVGSPFTSGDEDEPDADMPVDDGGGDDPFGDFSNGNESDAEDPFGGI